MMTDMHRSLIATALLIAILLCSCGKTSPITKDTAPFDSAITLYLKQKHMGMKVVEFESLTVSADSATAQVAMQKAEGLYGMKVHWVFTFKNTNGNWTAQSYEVAQ